MANEFAASQKGKAMKILERMYWGFIICLILVATGIIGFMLYNEFFRGALDNPQKLLVLLIFPVFYGIGWLREWLSAL